MSNRLNKNLFLPLLAYCISSSSTISEPLDSETFRFQSSLEKTNTLVLFTSQGCSSCPPAEKWLNSYSNDKDLWENTIPLAFHVDYWDYLGWKDPFSKKEFSALQRNYAKQGHVASVYTPGILVNNSEFRQWFYGQREWPSSSEKPGVLSVEVNGQSFKAEFDSAEKSLSTGFDVHTAWLGMGLTTRITSGENRARTLDHDFVVLSYKNHFRALDQALELEAIPQQGQTSAVFVVWVTLPGSVEIIQATAYPV